MPKYINMKTTPEAKRIIKVEAAKLDTEMGTVAEALLDLATRHPDYNRMMRVSIKRITARLEESS